MQPRPNGPQATKQNKALSIVVRVAALRLGTRPCGVPPGPSHFGIARQVESSICTDSCLACLWHTWQGQLIANVHAFQICRRMATPPPPASHVEKRRRPASLFVSLWLFLNIVSFTCGKLTVVKSVRLHSWLCLLGFPLQIDAHIQACTQMCMCIYFLCMYIYIYICIDR